MPILYTQNQYSKFHFAPYFTFKVHGFKIEQSKCEKYLGDLISETGKLKENLCSRRAKDYELADGIFAILDEIPLGKHKI